MTQREEWRSTHYPNYEVSNLGRVRSYVRKKPRILSGNRFPGKYLSVQFGRSGKRHSIHRLVMAAFVGPCPLGQEVMHADDDKWNAVLTNLSYGTRSENVFHAIALGRPIGRYQRNPNMAPRPRKLSIEQVAEIRALAIEGILTQRKLARVFAVSESLISAIVLGKRRKRG